jgi:hypothetical protein
MGRPHKRAILGLVAVLVSAALSGAIDHPSAHADGAAQELSGDSVSHGAVETALPPPRLADWPACASAVPSGGYTHEKGPRWLHGIAFSVLQDLLQAGIENSAALCIIDAVLIRSQDVQPSPVAKSDYFVLGGLMELVADNWKRQGVLERADQLYGQSYLLMQRTWPYNWATIWVLQDWAMLKLDLGQSERAKELASLQAALAREAYEESATAKRILAEALTLQANVLEKIGLANESQVVRAEAEALGDK